MFVMRRADCWDVLISDVDEAVVAGDPLCVGEKGRDDTIQWSE